MERTAGRKLAVVVCVTNHQGTKTRRMKRFKNIPVEVDRIANQVVDSAFKVHKQLGPGLLESVYETCLTHELKNRGLIVQTQVAVPIVYEGLKLDGRLRLVTWLTN